MKWLLLLYTVLPGGEIEVSEQGHFVTESLCVQVAELREYKHWACQNPETGSKIEVWRKK